MMAPNDSTTNSGNPDRLHAWTFGHELCEDVKRTSLHNVWKAGFGAAVLLHGAVVQKR